MLGSMVATAEALDAIQKIGHALNCNGFAPVSQITTTEDVSIIRSLIQDLISSMTGDEDHRLFHDLGDDSYAKGTQSQSLEINMISRLIPDLARSLFYQNALYLSRLLLGSEVQPIFDHCIIKPAGSQTVTEWHQDNAYSGTFSRTGTRLHWWLPLQAVDLSNSCMQFVAGTHLGPLLPHRLRSAKAWAKFANLPNDARPTVCPLQIGDATIHLAKTLHYTGPNNSDAPRFAWVVQFGVKHMIPHRVR